MVSRGAKRHNVTRPRPAVAFDRGQKGISNRLARRDGALGPIMTDRAFSAVASPKPPSRRNLLRRV